MKDAKSAWWHVALTLSFATSLLTIWSGCLLTSSAASTGSTNNSPGIDQSTCLQRGSGRVRNRAVDTICRHGAPDTCSKLSTVSECHFLGTQIWNLLVALLKHFLCILQKVLALLCRVSRLLSEKWEMGGLWEARQPSPSQDSNKDD